MTPEELKQARQKLKITQEEMAHRIGVAYATWNKWERGHRSPRQIYVEKIQSLVE